MIEDPTEEERRKRQFALNVLATNRAMLEKQYGQVWNTEQLSTDFEVIGFLAPYVVVRKKSGGKKGSLEFQHEPRFYFNFQEDG